MTITCPKCGRQGLLLPRFVPFPYCAVFHYEHIGKARLCIIHVSEEVFQMAVTVFILSKPVVVTKYVALAQAVPDGPVELQLTTAAGVKIETLVTVSQDANGKLVAT